MPLEIIATTDGHFIGQRIEPTDRPILLQRGTQTVFFMPDRTQDIGGGVVRLSNASYIIDAKA